MSPATGRSLFIHVVATARQGLAGSTSDLLWMRLQYEIDIEYAYPFMIVMDCSAMVGSAPLAEARFDVGSLARKMAEGTSSTSGREGDISLMNGGEYKKPIWFQVQIELVDSQHKLETGLVVSPHEGTWVGV